MTDSPSDLIAEHNRLDDWLTAENKRFGEHIKPVKTRMDEIKSKLHEMLLALGSKEKQSLSTDHGTAYTSTIVTPKVINKDAYLDFVNDNWEDYGNAMLQLGAPQKDALGEYQDAHDGQLPPGVETSSFIRVNIRRS